jgi:phage-related protein
MKIVIDKSIEKFILSLEKTTIAKLFRVIDLLQEFNYKLGMPHTKKIKKNLFELRISGKQEIRIFYTFNKDSIIFLHAFVKKSQKTPKRELTKTFKKLKDLTK